MHEVPGEAMLVTNEDMIVAIKRVFELIEVHLETADICFYGQIKASSLPYATWQPEEIEDATLDAPHCADKL